MNLSLRGLCLGIMALIPGLPAGGQELRLEWLESGAMQKIGNYMPMRLELTNKPPSGITKMPEGIAAPKYGSLKLGSGAEARTLFVVLDAPANKPARLWIDANANGNLADDPAPEWAARTNTSAATPVVSYFGGVTLPFDGGDQSRRMHLSMYWFGQNDPGRAALKSTLFYYRDYAWSGEATIGGKRMLALLSDDLASGSFAGKTGDSSRSGITLYLDVNGDKRFSSRGEAFDAYKPFNVGGTSYELRGLSASGAGVALARSATSVDEIKPPPTAGDKALPFARKALDGRNINFPADYKGKLVMLDFWATWCGPCVAELPNLIANYNKFHGSNFDVLGITLDNTNAAEKVQNFMAEKKMRWPQIYDGKGWQAEIGQLYSVSSIPNCLLVDGDTGRILATTAELRGPSLGRTLEKHLGAKK